MQAIKQWFKKYFGRWIYRSRLSAARGKAIEQWAGQWKGRQVNRLSDASYDVFTYHGEDGMLLYLLNHLQNVPPVFVDIGAGDCIKSNCANLAVHYKWSGLFIDKNEKQLEVGKHFYNSAIKNRTAIKFTGAEVNPVTINKLIQEAGISGPVGLLSIDIDGNDFWIWKAIEELQPAIVVVEAKVEFGLRSIAVPYGPANHHSADRMYNGASVEAFRKLGKIKGYKLAGANKQGYNLFFIREEAALPEVTAEEVLNDPQTRQSFYDDNFFTTHQFEII